MPYLGRNPYQGNFSDLNGGKLIFEAILSKLKGKEKFNINDLEIDSQLIEKIFTSSGNGTFQQPAFKQGIKFIIQWNS